MRKQQYKGLRPTIYLKGIAPPMQHHKRRGQGTCGKQGKSWVILTADNGVAMVVLDRQDYLNKIQDILAEKDTYRLITGDPSTKDKN